MVVLVAAFLAVLGLLSYYRLGTRRALFEVLLLAIAAGATSIYDLYDLSANTDLASGWGINLAAAASVGLGVSVLMLLFRRGRSLVSTTPPSATE